MVEEIVVARDEWRVMGGHGYISCTKAIFSSWSALTKSAPAITISSTFTFPSKLCLRSSTLAKRLRRVAGALGAAEAACC